jgi:hypothetical protein
LSKILNGTKLLLPMWPGVLMTLCRQGEDQGCGEFSARSRGEAQGGGIGRLPRDAVTPADVEAVAVTTKAFRDLGNRFRRCPHSPAGGEAERYALEASAMIEGLVRARAFNTAVLATAYVETDLDQALGAGRETLVMAAGIQSGRMVRYLADLRRRLRRRYGSDPKVRSFNGQLSETLGSR